MRFAGSFVALITPFSKKGRIDRRAIEALVDWHISQGTDGIVCGASTGEGVALSDKEKKTLAEICIKTAAGRIPILVSTGASGTDQTIRNTEVAKKLGAAGCLVVTPFYNRPTQRGCVAHYKEVSKVGLPVIVYHNPARAVVKLALETVEEIAPFVAAFKDSSHDLEYIAKVCKILPVFAGDDDVTLHVIRNKGVGCIGVVSNIVPFGWKRMIEAAMKDQWDVAEKWYERYLPLIKAIFSEVNPQGPKFAVAMLGRCHPIYRLPMVMPIEENQMRIRRELVRLTLPIHMASMLSREAPESG